MDDRHHRLTSAKTGRFTKRHGHFGQQKRSRAYSSWAGMITRCTNPAAADYYRYGGRGITVDPSWRDFAAFLADMGEPPPGTSLDRIDNDQGYSAANCKWSTRKSQGRNKRNNVYLDAFGIRAPLIAWAEAIEVPYHALYARLRDGWPHEKIVTTPSKKGAA